MVAHLIPQEKKGIEGTEQTQVDSSLFDKDDIEFIASLAKK